MVLDSLYTVVLHTVKELGRAAERVVEPEFLFSIRLFDLVGGLGTQILGDIAIVKIIDIMIPFLA
jgi:hypothetical protein